MKLPLLLATVILATAPAFAGVIHFDELGTSSNVDANNQHVLGVLFQFSGGSAQYNGTIDAVDTTALASDPVLLGDTSGTLTLTFDTPIDMLSFDIVMEAVTPITSAYTVSLPGNVSLSGDTAPLVFFSEGYFEYEGPLVSTATITFSNQAPQFAIDNLAFAAPEPGTSLLLGGALLGLSFLGRRNRQRRR